MDPKLPFGTKYCLCSGCGRYFTTPDTFDMHRVWEENERICRDPSSLVTKTGRRRLFLNKKGYWGYPPRGYREKAVTENGQPSEGEK